MWIHRRNSDGIHWYATGKGLLPTLFNSAAFSEAGHSAGARDYPRLTVTISGVSACPCTFANEAGLFQYYSLLDTTNTNKVFCLDRSLSPPIIVSTTGWHWEFEETADIGSGGGAGACSTPTSRSFITEIGIRDSKLTVAQVLKHPSFPAVLRTFYYSQDIDPILPVTVDNEQVACGADGSYVNIATGGTAMVELLGCGTNSPDPTTYTSALRTVASLRECCEVYDVALSGGTSLDGDYRLTKSNVLGIIGWERSPRVDRSGRNAVIRPGGGINAGRWSMGISKVDSTIETVVSASVTFVLPAGSASSCPTTEGWTLLSNTAGGSPVVTVTRRNCWQSS